MLETRATELLAALPPALEGSPEAIHHARVASRRLREAVSMLCVSKKGVVRRASRVLRSLTRALGRVRELDVSDALLTELRAATPLPEAAEHMVRRALTSARRDALRGARREWPVARVEELGAALAKVSVKAGALSVGALEPSALSRVRHRAASAADALRSLGPDYAPEPSHEVRIAVKKWRYALEALRALRPGRGVATLAALKDAQEKLGRAHDLHVLLLLVTRVGARRGRDVVEALRDIAQALDTECRWIHGAFLLKLPRLLALADRAVRITPASARGARRRSTASPA